MLSHKEAPEAATARPRALSLAAEEEAAPRRPLSSGAANDHSPVAAAAAAAVRGAVGAVGRETSAFGLCSLLAGIDLSGEGLQKCFCGGRGHQGQVPREGTPARGGQSVLLGSRLPEWALMTLAVCSSLRKEPAAPLLPPCLTF